MDSMMNNSEFRESITLISGNQKIFGIFHYPQQSKGPFPCVIMLHGFGSNKVGRFRRYVTIANRLAQAGIASIRFDFRGAGDSEGTLAEVTIERLIEDACVVGAYIQMHPLINKEKIGFLGSSLGGAVALLAAAKLQTAAAFVLLAPVFSGRPWFQIAHPSHSSSEKMYDPRIIIDPQTKQAFFQNQQLHPDCVEQFYMLNIEEALRKASHIPLLHIQGAQDTIVSDWHKHAYLEIRKQAESETRSIWLPHSTHDFSHTEEHEILLQETVNWFIKYLR